MKALGNFSWYLSVILLSAMADLWKMEVIEVVDIGAPKNPFLSDRGKSARCFIRDLRVAKQMGQQVVERLFWQIRSMYNMKPIWKSTWSSALLFFYIGQFQFHMLCDILFTRMLEGGTVGSSIYTLFILYQFAIEQFALSLSNLLFFSQCWERACPIFEILFKL